MARSKSMSKKGKILVVGSVVFDTIFEKTFYGGTGANIAYGLSKFGVQPMLFSLAGKDFQKDYSSHLRKSGVDLRVDINKNGITGSCYRSIIFEPIVISGFLVKTFYRLGYSSHQLI